jgi:hypothetical protein
MFVGMSFAQEGVFWGGEKVHGYGIKTTTFLEFSGIVLEDSSIEKSIAAVLEREIDFYHWELFRKLGERDEYLIRVVKGALQRGLGIPHDALDVSEKIFTTDVHCESVFPFLYFTIKPEKMSFKKREEFYKWVWLELSIGKGQQQGIVDNIVIRLESKGDTFPLYLDQNFLRAVLFALGEEGIEFRNTRVDIIEILGSTLSIPARTLEVSVLPDDGPADEVVVLIKMKFDEMAEEEKDLIHQRFADPEQSWNKRKAQGSFDAEVFKALNAKCRYCLSCAHRNSIDCTACEKCGLSLADDEFDPEL